jgi:hypothetical protein
MQKGQRIEGKHAESWNQVCLDGDTQEPYYFFTSLLFFYFASFLYSLKPYFFSLL